MARKLIAISSYGTRSRIQHFDLQCKLYIKTFAYNAIVSKDRAIRVLWRLRNGTFNLVVLIYCDIYKIPGLLYNSSYLVYDCYVVCHLMTVESIYTDYPNDFFHLDKFLLISDYIFFIIQTSYLILQTCHFGLKSSIRITWESRRKFNFGIMWNKFFYTVDSNLYFHGD